MSLKSDVASRYIVKISIPGSESVDIESELRQRDNKAMQQSTEKHVGGWNADTVLDCAVGWNLGGIFDKENVELVLDTYPMSVFAIVKGYVDEVYNARKGN